MTPSSGVCVGDSCGRVPNVLLALLLVACAAAQSRCFPWQCPRRIPPSSPWQRPSSAPAPPQGAPGGSERLGNPWRRDRATGQPSPRRPEPAASQVADATACGHPGAGLGVVAIWSRCGTAAWADTSTLVAARAAGHCSEGRGPPVCSGLLSRSRPEIEASPYRGVDSLVTLGRIPTLWCLRKGAKPPLLSRPGAKLAAHASPALGSTEMHEPADAARSGSSLVSQMQPAPWS